MRDDELGVGSGGLLGELGGGEEGVGGGDGGTAEGGAEEGEGEFGAVAEDKHDDVTLTDAEVVEAGGDAAGGEFDVGVGESEAGVGVDETRVVFEFG